MDTTKTLPQQATSHNSYFHIVNQSKWIDIAIVSGCVALLVIGLLATFNHAASLSYGMYSCAILLFIVEVVKLVIKHKKSPLITNKKLNQIGRLIFLSTYPDKQKLFNQVSKTLSAISALQNPQEYIAHWKPNNDALEKATYDIVQFLVSDKVQHVSSAPTENILTGPLAQNDVELLQLCVDIALKTDDYPEKSELSNYIKNILASKDFSNDPPAYMAQWQVNMESSIEKATYQYLQILVFAVP